MEINQLDALDAIMQTEKQGKYAADTVVVTETPEQIAEAKRVADEATAKAEADKLAAIEAAKLNEGKTPEQIAEEAKLAKEVEDAEAAKLKAEQEEADNLGLIGGLLKRQGFETDTQFEESEAGLDNVVDAISEAKAIDKLNAYLDSVPGLREYADFIQAGGDKEKLFNLSQEELDYSKVTVDGKDNEANQRSVIQKHLLKQGFKSAEINTAIEQYEAGGLLEAQAKMSLKVLQDTQKVEKETLIAQQKAAAIKEKEDNDNYWGAINTKLTGTGTIKNLDIPIKDKKALFNYMAIPVKDGLSQEQIDMRTEDIETRIALSYIRMNKLDISKLVANIAKTQIAETRKLAFKNAGEKKIESGTPPKGTQDSVINPNTMFDDLRKANGINF
jgi:hypothetical protein